MTAERLIEIVFNRYPDLSRSWFRQLGIGGIENGTLLVHAKNKAQQEYLNYKCRAAFNLAAQEALGRLVTVDFDVSEEDSPKRGFPGANLVPEFRLETFAIGPENQMVHAACVAAANSSDKLYNPLVISGLRGTGKSHLLQAICHQVRQRGGLSVYLPAALFIQHCVEAVELQTSQAWRSQLQSADLIALDDADALAGRELSQEECFHVLEHALRAGIQFVAAFRNEVRQVSDLAPRLASRFLAGLDVYLEKPSVELRARIAHSLAKRRCIDIGPEVVSFLALQAGDGHVLEQRLLDLDRFCRARGGVIDLPLAKLALQPGSTVKLEEIITAVAEACSVKEREVISGSRAARARLARELSVYLALRMTGLTIQELAEAGLGSIDSIERANQRAVRRLKEDEEFSQAAHTLRDALCRQAELSGPC